MGKSSGGIRNGTVSGRKSGYAITDNSVFQPYIGDANAAIRDFGIKGQIKITITNDKHVQGYAAQNIAAFDNGGNPFKNEIRINPRYKSKEIIRHELRHIMQGQKGQYYVKKVGNEKYHFWKDKAIISQTNFRKINISMSRGNENARNKYLRLPWEVDARNNQN